ncbi:hypothetical protein ACWT_4751 [Actinoplanes sp. SE50]|uniref:hypothetical protein n=1 Tax=unclassified Actinoplanes TaxID=2626549 RepID=UPI00023EC119|nr:MULTISPECIES: hypothetical protein [unclassified Actinoplanes]AEV85773.1 hypothetical protein ACPL_4882 [Actinoplanes sp. SE50/110]ATO84166.1 hypothetical protein ACWT_4751 [Actinoplanes sp. SE50]SLM01576.1 hypothetical protein ACSP50_4812 [Actinoplanes sp. SE50/110]
MTLPRPGDILRVGSAASVQFRKPILLRVIQVHDWTTYDGWIWISGYSIDPAGRAIERRTIFVQFDGLRTIPANRLPIADAADPASAE